MDSETPWLVAARGTKVSGDGDGITRKCLAVPFMPFGLVSATQRIQH